MAEDQLAKLIAGLKKNDYAAQSTLEAKIALEKAKAHIYKALQQKLARKVSG